VPVERGQVDPELARGQLQGDERAVVGQRDRDRVTLGQPLRAQPVGDPVHQRAQLPEAGPRPVDVDHRHPVRIVGGDLPEPEPAERPVGLDQLPGIVPHSILLHRRSPLATGS
jgi:hypothetical protein